MSDDKTIESVAFEYVGKKGDLITIQETGRRSFAGDRVVATDSSSEPGRGTRIRALYVGNRVQYQYWDPGLYPDLARLVDGPAPLAADFSIRDVERYCEKFVSSKPRGPRLDRCDPALFITFQVLFEKDCVFTATVSGPADTPLPPLAERITPPRAASVTKSVSWRGQFWTPGEIDRALATCVSQMEDARTHVERGEYKEAKSVVDKLNETIGRAGRILGKMVEKKGGES